MSILTMLVCSLTLGCFSKDHLKSNTSKPIKVFILAGDEMVLEHGLVNNRHTGIKVEFFPRRPLENSGLKHANYAVYKGRLSEKANFSLLSPLATGLVEVGKQRAKRLSKKKRGRVPVPYTPYSELAYKSDNTTVIEGFLSVKENGQYELFPGSGNSIYNVTFLNDVEVYRHDNGMPKPTIEGVHLEANKRYPFKTVFFKEVGHDFRLDLTNKRGSLARVVKENKKYDYLINKKGEWGSRDDVVIYDAHPIHNNTEAPARPLKYVTQVPGNEGGQRMGMTLSLGHQLGNAFDERVMILRYGVRHPIWFLRGSRDLSHDYCPPSSGGAEDLNGSWDVIHFNFGVWDATYRESSSKYFSGHSTTSVENFEKNLRILVAKMKKTGATLIWGSVTPVWEGVPGKPSGNEDEYNRVAAKVMKENGVIINDLNAESRRLGYPKSNNVHSVGNLAPKVIKTIKGALKNRKKLTKPFPRVLLIGDSITGSYQGGVIKELDGIAATFKNPGNGEDTWNGLERMDEWLNLNRYLLNGQEYLELVDGVKKITGEELQRAFPNYAGQGVELAGLIWFQGIDDKKSPAKSQNYETHLSNLIKDLRMEFNKPELPVVVVGMAEPEMEKRKDSQKVFEAQMAVGNPEKHPNFKGNVKSVDTRPMLKADAPGGRDPYKGHAESYLEIGEGVARSMLELLGRDKGEAPH